MQLKKMSLLCLMGITLSTNQGYAGDIIPGNSNTYYQLGGGSDYSMPPVTNNEQIRIGGDVNTNLGFTCTNFNPAIGMSNSLKNMGSSIQGLKSSLLGSLTSAAGSYAMYLLEKASPEMYNYLENGITDAEDTFNVSQKDCRTALSQIKQGKSPYQDWFSISDSRGFLEDAKRAKQGQDVDLNATVKNVGKDPKKYGVPWVHKGINSGGSLSGQVPINTIYDVAVAGYNVMVNPHNPLDAKETKATTGSALAHYWTNADAAGKWAQLVLGDVTISATADDTHPGMGLLTVLQNCPQGTAASTCAKTLRPAITKLVQNVGTLPTASDLKNISSNETLITPQVLAAIRNASTTDQAIAVSKLANDVALQNIVDQALLLRRLLIAGSQTKPVHNVAPAMKTVARELADLDQDINDVMFEHRIKTQLSQNTAQTLLAMNNRNRANATLATPRGQLPSVEHGAIYRNEGGQSS